MSEFSSSEKKIMEDVIDLSVKAIFTFIDKGIDKAMLDFNSKKEKAI